MLHSDCIEQQRFNYFKSRVYILQTFGDHEVSLNEYKKKTVQVLMRSVLNLVQKTDVMT